MLLGRFQDGTALEAHGAAVIGALDDREPVARFWRLAVVACSGPPTRTTTRGPRSRTATRSSRSTPRSVARMCF